MEYFLHHRLLVVQCLFKSTLNMERKKKKSYHSFILGVGSPAKIT